MNATDEELLVRLEAGDFAAADPLFDRYATIIFGIALRTLHDRGEAEDLVQDVFLHLCHKVKGFDTTLGSARTWIIQIAYRRSFDRRSYLHRRKFYDGTDVADVANHLGEESEAAMQNWLAANELHAAFDELNEKQRTTLEMFFFEGLDLREIAFRSGETLENTRHYYYRGLERLRRVVAAMSERDRK